ncbi:MAG: 2-amino-4-hydroxy-6-hydroxymethyldihydropteridine diphosphokinase [Gammaproteobacteria bacterium]
MPAVPCVDVYISGGSNLAPEQNIRLACRELHARFGRLEMSSVYRNPPVGFEGDDFLNLVFRFQTAQPPLKVVDELEQVHKLAGRLRGTERFGPRSLDLDLLLYGDAILPDPPIRVPRADIRRYAFVLRPLAELAPNLRHPETGETMAKLWAEFDQAKHPLQAVGKLGQQGEWV